MAKSPRKNTVMPKLPATGPPGKTILPPKNKLQRQRRFSLIDSDSDSSLSEFDERRGGQASRPQFQALQSESEDEDSSDDDSDSDSTGEELWKNHGKKVVNTSSEDEEEDDDDDDDDDSSSDDEDVDFVKLTAERKRQYRSQSPFQQQPQQPTAKATTQTNASKKTAVMQRLRNEEEDINFSFDWNSHDDHTLKLVGVQEEEEDVGEELTNEHDHFSPLRKEYPINATIGLVAIEDSESDGDIDKDELLRTLEQESDGFEPGIDTGDDDFLLLQQEADEILQDYNKGELHLSEQPTPRANSVVEDMIKKHKAETTVDEEALQFVSDGDYDDDDDEDDYENGDFIVPFFDDTAFKQKLLYNSEGAMTDEKRREESEDDDSYLWDYFFSGGEEDDDDSDDDDKHDSFDDDDEATDEDTTLPPPSSRKKVGAKAQELLSSSSIIARPPQLGTWSTDSKPFGIIDGLSTRSLLPTPPKNAAATMHRGPSTPTTTHVEEFTLDELLNMSELEDSEVEGTMDHAAWLEVTASTHKVPLSAFRNKGVMSNEALHLNATRRFSSSHPSSLKKSKKKHAGSLTPLNKKKSRKTRRRRMSSDGMRITKSGLFSEDTLTNVEEFLSGLGGEAELSVLLD